MQKIVEAFLLWNGNHTWKVLDVKAEGDFIGFDLATGQGSVIAHFTKPFIASRLDASENFAGMSNQVNVEIG